MALSLRDNKIIAEMLRANADKLDNKTMAEMLKAYADKLDNKTMAEMLRANADKLDNKTMAEMLRANADKLDNKTMTEMLRANADKLDNLNGDINYLIDSEKIDKTENLSSSIIGKLERLTARLDPLFVSMFAMLADISFATSLRIAKQEDDVKHQFNYFRYNINTDKNRKMLDKKLSPVF